MSGTDRDATTVYLYTCIVPILCVHSYNIWKFTRYFFFFTCRLSSNWKISELNHRTKKITYNSYWISRKINNDNHCPWVPGIRMFRYFYIFLKTICKNQNTLWAFSYLYLKYIGEHTTFYIVVLDFHRLLSLHFYYY